MASTQMPRTAGSSRVDVRMLANQTGSLQVTPPGPVLNAHGLRPGQDGVAGGITLRNVTAEPLAVRIGAKSAGPEVDDVLHIAVKHRGQALFRGPLGRLRQGARRPLRLSSGRSVHLAIRASIPDGLQSGFLGRARDVLLQFATSSTAHR